MYDYCFSEKQYYKSLVKGSQGGDSMDSLDVKTTLRNTLTHKQELVRDYQTFAKQLNNNDVAKMYNHFAEAEALHASQIKEKLEELS
jgi:rubrerythrin